MAPTWWYKVFSGQVYSDGCEYISDKNAVICESAKTRRVSILEEGLGREVNTSSTRQKFLQKVARGSQDVGLREKKTSSSADQTDGNSWRDREGKSLYRWQTWREPMTIFACRISETMTLNVDSSSKKSKIHWCDRWREVVGLAVMATFVMRLFKLIEITFICFKDYYGKIAQKLIKQLWFALNHFSEIFLWVLKDISAPGIYQKNGLLLLMNKKDTWTESP